MKLATEIVTNTPKEVVYFDYLTMEITPKGLLVSGKSPLFAPWIETQILKTAGTKPLTWRHQGQDLYTPLDVWNYQKPWGYASQGVVNYFADEKPNLIWLFHPSLAKGFEFLIGQPISLNNWEDYFTMCCRAIQEIYTRELRSATVSATFREILE